MCKNRLRMRGKVDKAPSKEGLQHEKNPGSKDKDSVENSLCVDQLVKKNGEEM